MTEAVEEEQNDWQMTQFIQTQRNYDVLMAILTNLNSEAAKNLISIHSTGGFIGPTPSFSGVFVADDPVLQEEDE